MCLSCDEYFVMNGCYLSFIFLKVRSCLMEKIHKKALRSDLVYKTVC